jgi:P27 family predicted phage terminase small subunit
MNAPHHLQPATLDWFNSVVETYTLEQHHVRLLLLACEAWDRKESARASIEKFGLVIPGREGGVKPNPAIAVERDSANRFAALVKQLGLDTETPAPLGRPPHSLRYANPWSKPDGDQ